MCGRYSLFFEPGVLEERFEATFEDDYEPRYNAAPGQELPVVANDDPSVITHRAWGLIPSWADDGYDGVINARAETVGEKPSFRDAFERRRCLVLADGFYEWVETEGKSRPYRITLPDGEPFAMAGLWERWTPDTTQAGLDDFTTAGRGGGGEASSASRSSTDGCPSAGDHDASVETFTIVTTETNEFVADLHDRMPVVLAPDEEHRWLETPDETLLDPYDGELRAYPVSTAVNDPSNDSPAVVEEVDG